MFRLESVKDAAGNVIQEAPACLGELPPEDIAENELSLREVFRLLSVYLLRDGTKVWIITESDRSATTILLPEEY